MRIPHSQQIAVIVTPVVYILLILRAISGIVLIWLAWCLFTQMDLANS
jgi:hypothetical protein